ncbi:MAG: AAA family ATPase [Oscillospiraceae bacterium]|jgi:predicted ABC-type ATPase|nr:AAA family ATPase [Oscillospiraceae bacterium]
MIPTKKQPLFIVSGASGVGKSCACEVLFQRETDYVVLESDILWNNIFDGDPDDGYRAYRELWLTMCANISQIGKPCVLCGCGEPRHFEVCGARKYFTDIYYLAIVCSDDVMERRMREGRGINDKNRIASSLHFNRWLQENGEKTEPSMTLLDNSDLTPEETAQQIEKWIIEKTGNENGNFQILPL